MPTHSSILTWKISWTEEPGGLLSMGSQKWSDTTEQLNNTKQNEQLRGRGRREEGGKEERDARGGAQKGESEEMTFPISAQLLSMDPDSERASTGILNIVWKLRSLHNY